jgi:hypothetical protein
MSWCRVLVVLWVVCWVAFLVAAVVVFALHVVACTPLTVVLLALSAGYCQA